MIKTILKLASILFILILIALNIGMYLEYQKNSDAVMQSMNTVISALETKDKNKFNNAILKNSLS